MQAEQRQHAQAETEFWQRTVRHLENTFPGIYQNLEEAMFAAGKNAITSEMVVSTLLGYYAGEFLPQNQVYALQNGSLSQSEFFRHCDTIRFNEAVTRVLIFSNWRLTQQVVAFDPDLASQIGWWPGEACKLDDDDARPLPIDHLMRLPYSSFVVVPGITDPGDERSLVRSMLIHVRHPDDMERLHPQVSEEAISFSVTMHVETSDEDVAADMPNDGLLFQALEAAKPGMSIMDAIAVSHPHILQPDEANVTAVTLRYALPYLLYLCTENCDVSGALHQCRH